MKVAAFAISLMTAALLGGCVYHHETVRERPSPPAREDQLAVSDTVLAYSDMSSGAALAAPRGKETGISL